MKDLVEKIYRELSLPFKQAVDFRYRRSLKEYPGKTADWLFQKAVWEVSRDRSIRPY